MQMNLDNSLMLAYEKQFKPTQWITIVYVVYNMRGVSVCACACVSVW